MHDDIDARPGDRPAVRLGELIRRRRRDLGLTQVQLAQMFEVDQSRISRWELGERVDARRLPRLAEWLDRPVEEVLALNYDQQLNVPEPQDIAEITVTDPEDFHELIVAAETLGLGFRAWNSMIDDPSDPADGIQQWHLVLLSFIP